MAFVDPSRNLIEGSSILGYCLLGQWLPLEGGPPWSPDGLGLQGEVEGYEYDGFVGDQHVKMGKRGEVCAGCIMGVA